MRSGKVKFSEERVRDVYAQSASLRDFAIKLGSSYQWAMKLRRRFDLPRLPRSKMGYAINRQTTINNAIADAQRTNYNSVAAKDTSLGTPIQYPNSRQARSLRRLQTHFTRSTLYWHPKHYPLRTAIYDLLVTITNREKFTTTHLAKEE